MKKLVSAFITSAIILSFSACGGNTPEATTAPKDDSSVSAETTAREAAPEEGNVENDFLNGLKDKSPLYYEFAKITTTTPVSITMTIINSDKSEGGTMRMTLASLESYAMLTEEGEQSARVILDNGTNYIVNDNEKYAMYYTLTDDVKGSVEEMKDSMQFSVSFDFDKAEFSSGTEEFMGETLKYETVDDGTTNATIYFDPETGRVKYMISDNQTVRVDDYYSGTDESLFEIPEDYEMIDFETLMGEAAATE